MSGIIKGGFARNSKDKGVRSQKSGVRMGAENSEDIGTESKTGVH